MIRTFGLLLVIASIVGMAACGSGGGGSNSSSVTSVTVSCSPTTVTSGGTSQCTATVSGTGNFNSAVNWSASAGTIDSSGLLSAPVVTTSLVDNVTATSVQNTGVIGTATVTVNPMTAGSNVAPITVDAGPEPQTFLSTNVAFTTVTVCVPGTTTCQTIDHIMVDTGSSGLRLISGVLSISLPQKNDSSGNPLDECLVFLDGFIWGPVVTADISMAGESAGSVPVQAIVPSSGSPAVPSSCSSQNPSGGAGNEGGSNNSDAVATFGANGIIGVGVFQQDCGDYCVVDGSSCISNRSPCFYYTCPPSGCNPANATLAQQLPNPVTMFPTDNNGVLIQLPPVPDGGSATVSGSLIFGIGTQSNNGLGSANVYQVPDSGNTAGNMVTTFNSQQYQAFVDSGSNGLFFLDSSVSGVPATCTGNLTDWYCPTTSPDNLTASNQGQDTSGPVGNPVQVGFSIEDADSLFNTPNTAFSTLGGPLSNEFDFGLSFFYGRNVFTAIENMNTPGGTGPYFAF